MSRQWFINGESMVAVKANSASPIASLTNLGLSEGDITVTEIYKHENMMVDAWGGGEVPADLQIFLQEVMIDMTLIFFDPTILAICENLAMGGVGTPDGGSYDGILPRTGATMGGGVVRFAPGNNYIGLNIASPVAATPWRFLYTVLTGTPVRFPLGTHKSAVQLQFRAIPYTPDPWQSGLGSYGARVFDHTPDV